MTNSSWPWKAVKWNGDEWPEKRWSVSDSDGAAVCISPRYADHNDLSDARLIAAAPELLAACEEMIGTLWFKSPHGADVINADAYKQMTDAIAKAKGQTQ